MTDWTNMDPADFGRDTRHVQTAFMLTAADGTALTPGADPLGTLDLFGASAELADVPPDGTPACTCDDPDCPDPVHQAPADVDEHQADEDAARPGPGQHPDNYVSQLACGHEYDSPEPTAAGQAVTCSAHGPTTVTDPAASWQLTREAYDRGYFPGMDSPLLQHPDPAAS